MLMLLKGTGPREMPKHVTLQLLWLWLSIACAGGCSVSLVFSGRCQDIVTLKHYAARSRMSISSRACALFLYGCGMGLGRARGFVFEKVALPQHDPCTHDSPPFCTLAPGMCHDTTARTVVASCDTSASRYLHPRNYSRDYNNVCTQDLYQCTHLRTCEYTRTHLSTRRLGERALRAGG